MSKRRIRKEFESSSEFRRFHRYTGMIQIAGSTLSNFSSIADYPTKMAQLILSGYVLLAHSITPVERLAFGFQVGIVLSQLIMFGVVYFSIGSCEHEQTVLCKSIAFLNYIYAGILITGWCSAELNKRDFDRFFKRVERADVTTQTSVFTKNKGIQYPELHFMPVESVPCLTDELHPMLLGEEKKEESDLFSRSLDIC